MINEEVANNVCYWMKKYNCQILRYGNRMAIYRQENGEWVDVTCMIPREYRLSPLECLAAVAELESKSDE